MKLSTYFHNRLLLILCVITFASCNQHQWYKNEDAFNNPKTLAVQLRSGMAYHYQGSVSAQLLNEAALKLDSSNANFWRELGVAPLKRGIATEMYNYYAKAVELDPLEWQGYRGYCYLYFYRDYERAIADFDALDTLTVDFTDYPQGQSVDYMRGIAYYGLKDFKSASNYFTTYIEEITETNGKDWVDTYAFLYRGLTFEKQNKLELALEDFENALQLYPDLSDCSYHKARILMKQGNLKQALAQITKAKAMFKQGFYHQRPYIEVLDQLYLIDIENLEKEILAGLDD